MKFLSLFKPLMVLIPEVEEPKRKVFNNKQLLLLTDKNKGKNHLNRNHLISLFGMLLNSALWSDKSEWI